MQMNVAVICGGAEQDIWTRAELVLRCLQPSVLCLFQISGVGQKPASGGADSSTSILLLYFDIWYSGRTYSMLIFFCYCSIITPSCWVRVQNYAGMTQSEADLNFS